MADETGARARRPDGPLLLGVRHHGPGSARAVRAALEASRPQVLLVEGPPEADAVVALAADEAMRPPVALLAHVPDEPGKAAFWPLAGFSPEWVAIRWALDAGVPVRFMDLPASHTLALGDDDEAGVGAGGDGGTDGVGDGDGRRAEDSGEGGGGESGGEAEAVRLDPLAALAEAAGYDDAERWWEDVVEHRGMRTDARLPDPYAPFAILAEAMAALREDRDSGPSVRDPRDELREAHMRLRLRDAVREFGAEHVAVVCGAWHVPALAAKVKVGEDRQRLKGLPKVKTELTWVPWTHRRLARRSGYGAGITSPGWYGHLFAAPDRPVERWLTKTARLLRAEDYNVSSAHIIEAVRLAETLAAMRGRPLAGLSETLDAAQAVLCEGSEVPLALVREQLVVGRVLGEVPEDAPAVPLQRDLARQQRTLRLKPEASERELELDLRKETDAARSRLLHRLRLLSIDWAVPARSRTSSTGTFRESWRLCWEPELAVRTAEAGVWGTTVEGAATAKAMAEAAEAEGLAQVTALAERCLLAELPDALPVVMRTLSDLAALDADVGRLAEALPALVRSVRYGTVRGTDSAALTEVALGLAERVCVGLPPACAGLDTDGAERMRRHVDSVHAAMALLAQTDASATGGAAAGSEAAEPGTGAGAPPASGRASGTADRGDGQTHSGDDTRAHTGADTLAPTGASPLGEQGDGPAGVRSRWRAALRKLASRDRIPGLIRGRSVRLLLDDAQLTQEEAARLMGLALSPGTEPPEAAEWIEGFLSGGGMLLAHDERLLALVDGWLTSVPGDAFTDVLPLLRRTFAGFDTGVRRTVGELVRRDAFSAAGSGGAADRPAGVGGPATRPLLPGFGTGLDEERADAVLPTLRLLLPSAAVSGGGRRTGREEAPV